MSVTSKFNTKAGDVTITFTMPVFGGTDTFQTLDIGTLDYDFDVTAFGSVVNNLGAMYGRTRLTVGYYTDRNRNFFDVLYNELYVSQLLSGKIPVNIKVDSYTGSTYEFNYEIRGNSLEHNENTTSIQLELDPVIPTTTISGVFSAITPKTQVGLTGLSKASGVLSGQIINYVVSGLNSNLPTLHEPAPTVTGYASLTYAIPVAGFFPAGIQLFTTAGALGASGLAINDVAQYAVLGGDIYGTGFDYNFYVNRLRTDRSTTIGYDDLQALKYSVTPSPYNAIVLTLDGTSGFVVGTTETEVSNVRSEKLISGFYSLPNYVSKAQYVSFIVGANTDYTGYTTSDLESVIVGSGILAHQKALNAQSTPLVRVEATVFGFDKIKPYNTIIFGDGVPDRYRYVSGTTARYYRPTYLSYNLKEDLIRVRMYGIS